MLHKSAQLFRDERTGTGAWLGVLLFGGRHGQWGDLFACAFCRRCSCQAVFTRTLPPPPLRATSCSAYEVPDGSEVEVFRNAIEALPDQDNPELFGLHSNADLTFRRLQVGGGGG